MRMYKGPRIRAPAHLMICADREQAEVDEHTAIRSCALLLQAYTSRTISHPLLPRPVMQTATLRSPRHCGRYPIACALLLAITGKPLYGHSTFLACLSDASFSWLSLFSCPRWSASLSMRPI